MVSVRLCRGGHGQTVLWWSWSDCVVVVMVRLWSDCVVVVMVRLCCGGHGQTMVRLCCGHGQTVLWWSWSDCGQTVSWWSWSDCAVMISVSVHTVQLLKRKESPSGFEPRAYQRSVDFTARPNRPIVQPWRPLIRICVLRCKQPVFWHGGEGCCRYTAQTPPPVTGRGLAIMVWFGGDGGQRREKGDLLSRE